ncbi:related to ribosomal protein YmS18, mitochondrial [Sporisorium reilianum f. sp. reilianum]|uniref:Related to ribosomal protein YmS18, mitochondrial n=1 Tax=Sporisorium reilianum f. sp. reilianum TaxID=72559 RepID=A0A2N8UNF4_9BASI|nr:related to ribosomal protein YmS18, mitochondrial [Sporisorium reilianum f. sp. reilianum]
MLRSLTKHLAPSAAALRTTLASGSICQPYRASAAVRTFATTSSSRNESDKSASTQSLESQASGQPTSDPTSTGSSDVSDAMQRDLSSDEASPTPGTGRQAAPSNLDDLLGSISAVSALPGSDAPSPDATSTFRDRSASPLARSSASRYAPLFSSTTTLPHRLFVNASRNNTVLTLTSPTGDPLASASGGSVGFKKSARSGYEAGYRAAFSMFGKINEYKDAWRIQHLEVLWNGFGQGREAVFRALVAGEGQTTKGLISKMTDNTAVKIGGVRPKKRRML